MKIQFKKVSVLLLIFTCLIIFTGDIFAEDVKQKITDAISESKSEDAELTEINPDSKSESAEIAEEALSSKVEEALTLVGKGISLHKQNYFLPLTWGNNDSTLEDAELKFQLSLKLRLFDTGFYAAYTQKSFWRFLDGDDSRPFRETNYNPEIFYRLVKKYSSGTWGGDLGYEHESNGSKMPNSRSWDRFYIRPYYEYKRFRGDLKIWYRIPEDDKDNKDDTSGDDNPDIEDYYGYSELMLRYEFENNQMVRMIGRWNPKENRCGLQMDYTIPIAGKNIFWVAQFWTGYGESLIDYNNYITSFGMGIMLKR